MKRFSVFALLMLVLLPVFVAAQQTNQQSTVPGNSLTASVAGTTWAGTDSDGDYYEYYFQANGALHYKSPGGFYKNGSWKQDGDKIYMETNKKYAERQGLISGAHMEGKAWNVKGQTWTWQAQKR
jgi:hypothetical protein